VLDAKQQHTHVSIHSLVSEAYMAPQRIKAQTDLLVVHASIRSAELFDGSKFEKKTGRVGEFR